MPHVSHADVIRPEAGSVFPHGTVLNFTCHSKYAKVWRDDKMAADVVEEDRKLPQNAAVCVDGKWTRYPECKPGKDLPRAPIKLSSIRKFFALRGY